MPRVGSSDVKTAFQRSFVRDNLVFAFSGDLDEAGAALIAKRISDALPDGPAPVDTTPEPVAVPGRRLVIVDKPERTPEFMQLKLDSQANLAQAEKKSISEYDHVASR